MHCSKVNLIRNTLQLTKGRHLPTNTESLEINTISFHNTKGKLDSKQKQNKRISCPIQSYLFHIYKVIYWQIHSCNFLFETMYNLKYYLNIYNFDLWCNLNNDCRQKFTILGHWNIIFNLKI